MRELTNLEKKERKLLKKMVSPLSLKFRPRDLMQVLVGASILAVPVAFTEETWNLGQNLPLTNILGILGLSLIFISSFVYYNFYRHNIKGNLGEFVKRTLSIYIVSFAVVALLLTLIERAPWTTDKLLAFKRVVLIAFPASMSAAVSDMIK
jgi:uncharacterized membrane protein